MQHTRNLQIALALVEQQGMEKQAIPGLKFIGNAARAVGDAAKRLWHDVAPGLSGAGTKAVESAGSATAPVAQAVAGGPLRTAADVVGRNVKSVGNLARNPSQIPGVLSRNMTSGLGLAAKHPLAAAGLLGAGGLAAAGAGGLAGYGYGNYTGSNDTAAKMTMAFQDQNVLSRLLMGLNPGMLTGQLPPSVQARIAKLRAAQNAETPPNPLTDWAMGR